MTWTPPKLIVRVARAHGPRDTPGPGDWTDLSDRVKEGQGKRGRSDERSTFQPGTVSIILDNDDRMLDPLNPDGLVPVADGLGLPMCPVTVDWLVDGVEYRKFTGFLGPDCWPADYSVRGENATVELQAMDEMGWSTEYPSEPWHILTRSLAPDWWLPMDGGFPVLADGSEIPNRSGTGGTAVVYSPSGISRYSEYDGGAEPGARLATDNVITSVAADVMPEGDELNLTAWCWFRGYSNGISPGDIHVMSMVEPGGGDKRWELVIDAAGVATVSTYDAAGILVDSAEIDWTALDLGLRLAGLHLLIVRFTSGNNLDVWLGGYTPVGGTLTATSTVYESDLYCGPGTDDDLMVDEVTVLRRALTDEQIAGIVLFAGGQVGIWHGDLWLDRLGHWFDAAGKTVDVDVTNEWHMPTPDPDGGLFGLGFSDSVPSSLTAAMEDTAAFAGGAAWVTREGRWRVRSLQALTDPTYAEHYADTCAVFTDADETLDPGVFRHAGIEPRGSTVDTVINRVEAAFFTLRDDQGQQRFTIAPQDDESIARYGIRSETFNSQWWSWADNAAVADAMLARYKDPAVSVQTVKLDVADDETVRWLAEECELERAVSVTYTPYGDDPVTFADLNIQGESWSLGTITLTVELTVARS